MTPRAIAAGPAPGTGARRRYAIGSDGNVYAWGNGVAGELGDGTAGDGFDARSRLAPARERRWDSARSRDPPLATQSLTAPNVAPAITTQPTNQTVTAGQNATFTAAASGFPAPTVQWQVSTDDGGSFSPVRERPATPSPSLHHDLAQNGDEYEAVFTNGPGRPRPTPPR